MFKRSLVFSFFIITNVSLAVESAFQVKKNNGTVKFFAIGNPSAIRIDGVGPAPEGTINLEASEKNSQLKGALVFDLNTLNTGIDMRDSHMKENYLEVQKFPSSTIIIDPVQFNENILKGNNTKSAEFKGKLNLHGEEKPISGKAEISTKDDQLKVTAKFKLKSSDFKIETPSFAGITMADEVDVEVNLNLLKTKI